MTAGVPGSPCEVRPGADGFYPTMSTDKNNDERGEKRGVLGTGRAKDLDKTKDADADAATDDDEEG